MRKISIIAMVAITLIAFISCTDNQRARKFGGTETVSISPNEKFINIAWRGDDLWLVLQDTISGEIYAREKSSYGIVQGKIIIQNKNNENVK